MAYVCHMCYTFKFYFGMGAHNAKFSAMQKFPLAKSPAVPLKAALAPVKSSRPPLEEGGGLTGRKGRGQLTS